MEKTAVEFLIEQLLPNCPYIKIIDEAKAMFRQQIEDAYKEGRKDDVFDYYQEEHASEYYTTKYGG